jgi:hypothetical protein
MWANLDDVGKCNTRRGRKKFVQNFGCENSSKVKNSQKNFWDITPFNSMIMSMAL